MNFLSEMGVKMSIERLRGGKSVQIACQAGQAFVPRWRVPEDVGLWLSAQLENGRSYAAIEIAR